MIDLDALVAQDARHDWTVPEAQALLAAPFMDLLYAAQRVHRRHFDANRVQISTLLSIKTGGCPEDCAYCPQSVHFDTGLEGERLMPLAEVAAAAVNYSISMGLYRPSRRIRLDSHFVHVDQ